MNNMLMRIKAKIFRLRLMLESDPFKVAELWRKIGVPIGQNTAIYHDVVISGDGKEPVVIGSNCVLTGCALIAHDASTNRYLGLNYGELSPTQAIIVEDGCFIGYHSIILMGVRIGNGSIVGAGAVVTRDVPANSVVAGNPARVVCSVDELVDKRKQMMTHA
jgi:maltose O-acetyltransferase